MGLQWVTRVNSGLQQITVGYKGLQGVTRGYGRLHGVTAGYKGLQGAQGPTGGYNRKLGSYTGLTQEKLISFIRTRRKLVFTIKMKNVTNPLRVICNYIG